MNSRTIRYAACAVIATAGICSEVQASLLAYEPFGYASAASIPSSVTSDPGYFGFANGTADNGYWTNASLSSATGSVASGSLTDTVVPVTTSGNSISLVAQANGAGNGNVATYTNLLSVAGLPSDTSAGSVFVSCLVQPTTTATGGAGLLQLLDSSGVKIVFAGFNNPATNVNWGITVFKAGTGEFGFGSGNGGAATGASVVPVTTSTTLLVLKLTYNGGNDSVTEWVNPTSISSTPSAVFSSSTNNADLSQLGGIGILTNSGTASGASDTANWDEIRVGNTFADVVPTPEPASLGIVGIAATSLLARRRRSSKF